MIKFKLDITLTEGEDNDVQVEGPCAIKGKSIKAAEVLAVAHALSNAIDLLMPQIEALPGHGPLEFAKALNRPLMEWAEKR